MSSFNCHSDEHGPILASVVNSLVWRGFDLSELQADIPTTQNGAYRFETYRIGSANLAILSLPRRVATEANLFLGPCDGRDTHISFQVHTLAGSGELLITKPGSYGYERIPLYRGAAVAYVRPGTVYAYRASDEEKLVVADFCDPAFQAEWDRPLGSGENPRADVRLPPGFWRQLHTAHPGNEAPKGTDCTQE